MKSSEPDNKRQKTDSGTETEVEKKEKEIEIDPANLLYIEWD